MTMTEIEATSSNCNELLMIIISDTVTVMKTKKWLIRRKIYYWPIDQSVMMTQSIILQWRNVINQWNEINPVKWWRRDKPASQRGKTIDEILKWGVSPGSSSSVLKSVINRRDEMAWRSDEILAAASTPLMAGTNQWRGVIMAWQIFNEEVMELNQSSISDSKYWWRWWWWIPSSIDDDDGIREIIEGKSMMMAEKWPIDDWWPEKLINHVIGVLTQWYW